MTIVVPVIRSPEGEQALSLAIQKASEQGARVVLVGTATVSDQVATVVKALRRHMSELEEKLRREGIECVCEWSVDVSAGGAILDAARKHKASLVVMGLRRRSTVGKLILGSYELEVLLHAPCPVLSVTAPVR